MRARARGLKKTEEKREISDLNSFFFFSSTSIFLYPSSTFLFLLFFASSFFLDKIQSALAPFDPRQTVSEFKNSRANLHLIKGKGISSYEALTALVDGSIQNNPKAKKIELEVNPKLTLSLIKSNELISLDEPRNQFLANLRQYVEIVERQRLDPHPPPSARLSIMDDPTLRIIQDHVLFTANLRLASEASPHTLSMQAWADSSSAVEYPKRVLSLKECGELLRVVRKADHEIDILGNGPLSKHVSVVSSMAHNCFHCPSFAYSSQTVTTAGAKLANEHKNAFVKVQFTDRIMSGFNALRARPLDSIVEIMAHLDQVHSISDASVSQRHLGHRQLLWCRICAAEQDQVSPHLFVCCLQHLQVVKGTQ